MPHALHSVALPPAPSAHPWRQSGVPVAAHAALAQRLLALFHFPPPLLPSCSALIVEIATFKAVETVPLKEADDRCNEYSCIAL
jgi:hypothetical protein